MRVHFGPSRAAPVAGRHESGFSYVEVLVTVVLVAIAVVPAADALRNAGGRAGALEALAAARLATLSRHESVLASDWNELLRAGRTAASAEVPTDLSDEPGTPDRRLVYVARYDPLDADGDGNPFTAPDADLDGDGDPWSSHVGTLWVRVADEDGRFALDTLLAP